MGTKLMLTTREEQAHLAWSAAANYLRDQRWHSWDNVIPVAADASGLRPQECGAVLLEACRAGHLVRQGQNGRRQVRMTPRGFIALLVSEQQASASGA